MQNLQDYLTPRRRSKGKTPVIEDSSTGSETEHSSNIPVVKTLKRFMHSSDLGFDGKNFIGEISL